MRFKEKETINIILESLFDTYSNRVPDVKKITNALIDNNIVSNQSELMLLELWALIFLGFSH
jgi:hypothetical protein